MVGGGSNVFILHLKYIINLKNINLNFLLINLFPTLQIQSLLMKIGNALKNLCIKLSMNAYLIKT